MEDWNDLKLLLVISESGTLRKAADLLDLDVSTVSRRLVRIEEELGEVLFHRKARKFEPTGFCQSLVQMGNKIRGELLELPKLKRKGSHFHLSTVESLAFELLGPRLGQFLERNRNISLTVDISNENKSFFDRKVDVALRLGRPRVEEGLILKKISRLNYSAYGRSVELGKNPIRIGFEEEIQKKFYPGEMEPALKTNSITLAYTVICNSRSVGLLPSQLAKKAKLKKTGSNISVSKDVYLIYRERLKFNKPFLNFKNFISESLA